MDSARVERYDWERANNHLNQEALRNFHRTRGNEKPLCMNMAICARHATMQLGDHKVPIACGTGTWSYEALPETAALVEVFALNPLNRTSEGFLMVTPTTSRGGYGGYSKITVPLSHLLQGARNTRFTSKELCVLVHRLPALGELLESLFARMGLVPTEDHQALEARIRLMVPLLDMLVQDGTRQVEFLWHDDVSDNNRTNSSSSLTAIFNLSNVATCFRLYGFKPFYFSKPGQVCVFQSLAVHQSVPRHERYVDEIAVKAVAFLEPTTKLPLPFVNPRPERHYAAHAWHEVTNAWLHFVDQRRLYEFLEEDSPLPAASDAYVSTSALSSLARMLENCMKSAQAGKELPDSVGSYGVPAFFTCTCYGQIVGIVWHDVACLRPRTGHDMTGRLSMSTVNVFCIAAFSGCGSPLHRAFCESMQQRNVVRLQAPMAHCRLLAAGWLKLHCWRLVPDSTPLPAGTSVKDGDILSLDLTVHKAECTMCYYHEPTRECPREEHVRTCRKRDLE